MKKVKSGTKKNKVFSDLFDPEDDSPKKRKAPSKNRKPQNPPKKKAENLDETEIKEEKPELIFQGIGEKDPSLSQIKMEELEYPYWLKPENLKDAQGRPCDSQSDYDPSTIQIPEQDFNKFSPIFKQYWEIKSKNFDKIVFFKFLQSFNFNFFFY